MRLVVLGSGSTVPHPHRKSAAFWLETTGGNILLDCSASAPSQMAALKLDWPTLAAIWISHFHMDHCGGLGPLLAGTKHAEQMRDRQAPLRIVGPPGIRALIDRFDAVNNYRLTEQPFRVEICEVDELESFDIVEGVEAVAMSTAHTTESHAIHIRDQETRLMYSSDTSMDEKIATFANGVDLAIMECTFFKDKPVKKHLELAEAMHLIRKARPKRAMLTHFYPEWDDLDLSEEVRKFDPPCDIIEANDGLVVDIP